MKNSRNKIWQCQHSQTPPNIYVRKEMKLKDKKWMTEMNKVKEKKKYMCKRIICIVDV